VLDDWVNLVKLYVKRVLVVFEGSLEEDEFDAAEGVAIAVEQGGRYIVDVLGLHEDDHE
jgi:hypothetical protein